MTELTLSIRKRTNLNEILLMAQEALFKCMGADFVFTAFANRPHTSLMGRLYVGSDLTVHAGDFSVPLSRPEGLICDCFQKGRSLRTATTREQLGLTSAFDRLHIRHAILVPVVVFGQSLGLYCILKTSDPEFTDEQLSWAEAVAAHVAMSFEQSNQREQ